MSAKGDSAAIGMAEEVLPADDATEATTASAPTPVPRPAAPVAPPAVPAPTPAPAARADFDAISGLLPASLPGLLRFVVTSAALALGIAALVMGQPVLMPLAFAALLAFVLDPIVGRLRRLHVPLAAAVAIVVMLTLAVLVVGTTVVVQQALTLSRDLPRHQATIQKKLHDIVPAIGGGGDGAMAGASRVLDVVEKELSAARESLPGATKPAARAPARVVMEPTPVPPLKALGDLVAPFLIPLATAGLVLLLLAFMLLQRLELRDRLVKLTGGDLHRMADALSESGRRVSRYLLAQVLVNVGYGVPMALGLWWIGVPGAFLWGSLAAVMRFVPYLGPAVSAIFPLVVAFAVVPGWEMVLWTAVLILVLELISNNIVEPLAYGNSTGVSPVAVVLSAAFWALLWGPVGLVLATPLTVVLVVMGRHLAPLRFMDLLLGSAPVFDTATQLYQRLISGDQQEAQDLARLEVARRGLATFYSDTAIPMLALATRASSVDVTAQHRHRLLIGVGALLQSLRGPVPERAAAPPVPARRVLCVGARTEYDTLSAEMLAHALRQAGADAQALSPAALAADQLSALVLGEADVVCLCTFNVAPQTHTRFVTRRLKRRQPAMAVVLAAWCAPDEIRHPGGVRSLGARSLAVTLNEAVAHLLADPGALAASAAVPDVAATAADERVSPSLPMAHVGAVGDLRLPVLHELLARHVQRAAEVFDMPLTTVLVRTAEAGTVQISAGAASWTQRDSDAGVTAGSPLDVVLSGGVGLIVPDVTREPRFAGRQDLRFDGLDFFAGEPLRRSDKAVLGTLALHDGRARQFSEGEHALLVRMADELAQAIVAQGFAVVDDTDEAPSVVPSAGVAGTTN